MDDDAPEDADPVDDDGGGFRAFAMACRSERDRLALGRLHAEDDRFETATQARGEAGRLAAEVLAQASRPRGRLDRP